MIDPTIQSALNDAQGHMQKTIEHLRTELGHIRAGRATPGMVEDVRVDYYGSHMPINQLASVTAPSPDLLVIQPWDRSSLNAIEKGIMAANIGLNPSNDGIVIRLPIPPLSQERRTELAKVAKHRCEDAKVAIRNIRRDSKEHIKKVQKDNKLSEDMRFEAEDALQHLTDDSIGRIDRMLERKEAEIMEV